MSKTSIEDIVSAAYGAVIIGSTMMGCKLFMDEEYEKQINTHVSEDKLIIDKKEILYRGIEGGLSGAAFGIFTPIIIPIAIPVTIYTLFLIRK